MNKTEAAIKQINIKDILAGLEYETLEMIFIQSKRELDDRFLKRLLK